jgi:L-fuculose-phosphate aldolase
VRPAAVRAQLVAAGVRGKAAGLFGGTAGNLSVRVDDLVAITPSGVDCGALRPELIGWHALDGSPVEAELRPSSELPLHLAVHAARGPGAVVHTHSPAAAAVSTLVDELPAVHYYAAALGEVVRVAPYAPFGSAELAAGAVRALGDSAAVLLAHHGAVTTGADVADALEAAMNLEWVCDVFLRAAAAGSPRVLDRNQCVQASAALAAYRAARPST